MDSRGTENPTNVKLSSVLSFFCLFLPFALELVVGSSPHTMLNWQYCQPPTDKTLSSPDSSGSDSNLERSE